MTVDNRLTAVPGILNTWKWPEIEGLHDFKGPILHSACWDHSVEFKDKKAAVIGVGSTSVQITPSLQKICKEVQVYMRSPTWISPPFGAGALTEDLQKGQDVDPGQRQYNFSEADIKKFREDPEYHLNFRKRIEAEINSLFGMYKQNSDLSNQFREVITKEMHRRMGPGHDELKKFIIPDFSPGCRRISPGDGFLEALVQDNVTPVFSGIKRVVPEGIETEDGQVHEVDRIVCATGFQVAFQPAFTVVNGQGKSIKEDWTDGPNLYFGVSAPRFPNFYTIVGPRLNTRSSACERCRRKASRPWPSSRTRLTRSTLTSTNSTRTQCGKKIAAVGSRMARSRTASIYGLAR
jgi:cation diffusion facilitator CzcD-associated flavoprotein CzcO